MPGVSKSVNTCRLLWQQRKCADEAFHAVMGGLSAEEQLGSEAENERRSEAA